MTSPPAGQGSDRCAVCGHAEDAHVIWAADETYDGWAHCTIGTGKSACTCWREWPRTPAESDDPHLDDPRPVAPHSDDGASPLTRDHDWRYVVRTVGRVLIATGLLLGGFVAYQLWGTGLEAQRAQSALEDEFEELLTSVASTTTLETSTTVPTATAPDTVPATAPETVPAPVAASIPPIAEGDPVARLEIPEIGVDIVVVAGVSVADLKRGPGHYPDTPLPGQFGNAAIAGHRTTYGQPFHDIDDLEPGDQIIATTLAGRFVYQVTGTQIVEPNDTHVVATTNPDIAELTLTSCHPKWSARQRIIVHSTLVADESAPIGHAEGAAPTTTIATVTSAVTSAVTATTTPDNTTTTIATVTSAVSGDDPTITGPAADAFSDGWFHDRSAIPQVVLWALAVAAIAVAAHVLSRRLGSKLVGIAVGIVPFLVALYFFYQNVNRLLPPSL